MRGFGRKADGLFEAALQTIERRVQHGDEFGDLISRRRDGQTLVEILHCDPRSRLGDCFDGRERLPRHPAAADCDHNQNSRDRSQHCEENVPPDPIYLLHLGVN